MRRHVLGELPKQLLAVDVGDAFELRDLARIRAARHQRNYAAVVAAFTVYDRLVRRADTSAVRDALAQRTLLTTEPGKLFEMYCPF